VSLRFGWPAAGSESVSPQHLGARIPIADHAAPPTARASRGYVLWRFSYAGRRRLQHDWRAAGMRSFPFSHKCGSCRRSAVPLWKAIVGPRADKLQPDPFRVRFFVAA
jgi:hypothetical protein